MTPTDEDRKVVQEWLARQRNYDPIPELTPELLAELVAAGHAQGREEAAKIAESHGEEIGERCWNHENSANGDSKCWTEIAAAIRAGH